MADPVKPFAFDEKAFQAKITSLTDELMKFSGKRGYNPFIEIEKLKRFKTRFDGDPNGIPPVPGERTEELYKAVMAMTGDIKPVTSTEEPKPEPVPAGARQLSGPTGPRIISGPDATNGGK